MVKTPSLHRLSSTVTAVIIFFSVFSSILSTFGYIQFIPAVFALSGAATAWTSYSQTELVLVQTNAAINQLNQLVIWWDALSMIEKRVGANKEFMVKFLDFFKYFFFDDSSTVFSLFKYLHFFSRIIYFFPVNFINHFRFDIFLFLHFYFFYFFVTFCYFWIGVIFFI